MQPQSANQDTAPIPTKAPKKGNEKQRTKCAVKIKKESQGQTRHQSKAPGCDLGGRKKARAEEKRESQRKASGKKSGSHKITRQRKKRTRGKNQHKERNEK